MRRLGLLALLVIAAIGAGAGWLDSQISRPYRGHRPEKVFVDIPHGKSRWAIAGILRQNDVIRDRLAFALFSFWHVRTPRGGGTENGEQKQNPKKKKKKKNAFGSHRLGGGSSSRIPRSMRKQSVVVRFGSTWRQSLQRQVLCAYRASRPTSAPMRSSKPTSSSTASSIPVRIDHGAERTRCVTSCKTTAQTFSRPYYEHRMAA